MKPEDIKSKIETEATAYDKSAHSSHTSGEDPSYHYTIGAEYGYYLAQGEIKRLTKLIEAAHTRGWNDVISHQVAWRNESWQQFKIDNNI